MLFTGKMSYMQAIVLEKEFEKTIDLLGEFGWVEIKRSEGEKKEQFIKLYEVVEEIEKKITSISDFFGFSQLNDNGELKEITDIDSYFTDLSAKISPQKEKLAELIKKKRDIENNLKEIEQFKNLNITKKELDEFSFVHFFAGSMSDESAEIVRSKLGDRVIIVKLEENFYMLFTSKKGRWPLESVLKLVDFKERKLTGDGDFLPSELFVNLTNQINGVDKELKAIEQYKEDFLKKEGKKLKDYIYSFNLQKIYQGVYQTVDHSDSISLIEGWILKKKIPQFNNRIKDVLGEKFSVVIYEPEELEEVKNGHLQVPVLMENIKPIKPFEMLIFGYGTPSYKSFDPTTFFSITFLLFFGMMFGDMGQGFVLLVGGLILQRNKNFKDFGYIISCAGFMSMIFGFIYGSAFCFERDQMASFLTPINHKLFGIDEPSLVAINQENSNKLFLTVIGIGFFINMFGMLINVVNGFRRNKIINILFAPTGLAGLIMVICVVLFIVPMAAPTYGLKVVFDQNFYTILKIIIGLSLVLIFFKEAIENIIKGHKPIFHGGLGFSLFISAIDVFEVLLNTLSNNLSFIRIAAFAFSHSILSAVVMNFAIGSTGNPFTIAGILILIVGNVIILGLEGLIVGIQSIRLEYYEFFSKFFKDDFGRQFVPFKIEKLIRRKI